MGGHHASYRANPGRPLFLLPALRSALFGDVRGGGRALISVMTIMLQNVWSAHKPWLRRVQPTFPTSSSCTDLKTPNPPRGAACQSAGSSLPISRTWIVKASSDFMKRAAHIAYEP